VVFHGLLQAKIVFKPRRRDPELAAELSRFGSGRIVYIATSQPPAPAVVREKPLNNQRTRCRADAARRHCARASTEEDFSLRNKV